MEAHRPTERRTRRAEDPATALALLLASQRAKGGFSRVALASMEGMLVASDHDDQDSEALAAFAPLVARGERRWLSGRDVEGVAAYAFSVGDDELVLVTRGGDPERAPAAVRDGLEGATRILGKRTPTRS